MCSQVPPWRVPTESKVQQQPRLYSGREPPSNLQRAATQAELEVPRDAKLQAGASRRACPAEAARPWCCARRGPRRPGGASRIPERFQESPQAACEETPPEALARAQKSAGAGPRASRGRGLGSHVGGARRVGAGGDPARSASREGGGLAEGTAASAAAPASPRSQAALFPPVSPVPSELQPSGELGESRHQASPCAGRWRGTAGAPAAAVSLSHSLCRVSGQSLWGILFPALRQEPGSPGWAREPLRRDSHS